MSPKITPTHFYPRLKSESVKKMTTKLWSPIFISRPQNWGVMKLRTGQKLPYLFELGGSNMSSETQRLKPYKTLQN